MARNAITTATIPSTDLVYGLENPRRLVRVVVSCVYVSDRSRMPGVIRAPASLALVPFSVQYDTVALSFFSFRNRKPESSHVRTKIVYDRYITAS